MSDDLQLNRDDFEDCFAGQPTPVSVADDLARGQHRLRRRRRMAGGAVAGVVAVVVLAVPLLTSQTFGPRPVDPAQTPTAQPTSMRTQAMTTCSGETLKIAEAIKDPAQRPIDDVKFQPAEEDGKSVMMLSVAATGEVLLEVGRDSRSQNDVTKLYPGELYIEDPATGKRTLVRGGSDLHEGTQTIHAVFDQDFVVWVETPDTSIGASNWKMYAFNRATGKISQVASSPKDPGGLQPQPLPRLWNGSVYWEVGRDSPEVGPPRVVDIYARTLDLSEPAKRVVENAVQPVPTEGWLYYERYDNDGGEDPKDGRYAVYRTSLTGDRTELVHEGAAADAGTLAAFGDFSAWSELDDVVVYRGDTLVARLVPPKGDSASGVTLGNETVGFISGNGGEGEPENDFLLDLRGGCRLHQLDDAGSLAGVMAAGQTVAWAVPDPDHDRYAWYVGRLR